ncbi:MAG: uroporphyrinogen decarboxylase family protein [Armatimonadia bacterium]
MERQYYLNLAQSGLKMPIGTDLVLHEQEDAKAVLRDGVRLGQVMAQAANRYRTPLALPVMNLELEKEQLLALLEVDTEDPARYHFGREDWEGLHAKLEDRIGEPLSEPMQALCDALTGLRETTALVPVGMCIGPFSLMTKLLADPITPIAMAGMGMSAEEDKGIAAVEGALELAVRVIERYIEAQCEAGAKAIVVCEPAANNVYLSPKQIESGSDIFERFVMQYLRRLKYVMLDQDVDLILHDCGELTDWIVQEFARLDPAILSLGSSRKLWEDARLLPKTIVLFGNLPSKRFYSDNEITRTQVEAQGAELVARMQQVRHPFILGSECDVLHVEGCEETIQAKAMAIVGCCGGHGGGVEEEVVAAASS